MVSVRATPATVLPTVRQLAQDISRWSREAGRLSAMPDLDARIELLIAAIAQPRLLVEVIVPTADRLEGVASRLADGVTGASLLQGADARLTPAVTLRFQATIFTARVPLQPHELRAPVAVLDVPESAADDYVKWVVDAIGERPVVFITTQGRPIDGAAAGLVEVLPAETSVAARLGQAPFATLHDVLRADGAARAIEATTAVLSAAIEQELRGIKAKRVLAQQSAAKPASKPADAPADLRLRIQSQFTEFRRGVEDRADRAFNPHVGPIIAGVDKELAALTTLVEQRRGKVLRVELPERFRSGWTATLQQQILSHCHSDLRALDDLFRMTGEDIERTLATGPPPFRPLSDERLRRTLEAHQHQRKPFSGEMPQRSFFEYVMMARRYQMMLFMAISAFGASWLRRYQAVMLPAAIILLSFGSWNVYTSMRRERRDFLDKELQKARDQLRGEASAMLSEVQRAWSSAVSQHLTEESTAAASHIEHASRQAAAREQQFETGDRTRLQRQVSGFEGAERKLQAASRGREALAAAVAQFRGELRQLVAASSPGRHA